MQVTALLAKFAPLFLIVFSIDYFLIVPSLSHVSPVGADNVDFIFPETLN